MEAILTSIYTLISTPLKLSFWLILLPSFFVLFSAILSAKSLGGELGVGLKKIAAGTVSYVILYVIIIAKEYFEYDTMSDDNLRLFFLFINIFASGLLIWGFYQIYRVSKRLRLF